MTSNPAKFVLREALNNPNDENSVPSYRTMIGQALRSAANFYGYKLNDSDMMIVEVEDLLNLAYEFTEMDGK